MAKRLQELEQQSSVYELERSSMKDKFSQSLSMLKELKEQQAKLDDERGKQSEELSRVKAELQKREQELQQKKEREFE